MGKEKENENLSKTKNNSEINKNENIEEIFLKQSHLIKS